MMARASKSQVTQRARSSWTSPRLTRARALLPDAVTVIGLPATDWLLEDPATGQRYLWDPREGSVIVAAEHGRSMFLLRPQRDAGAPGNTDQAVRAFGLWERFTHRAADGYYNAIVPSLRKPRFSGLLVMMSYRARKDLDDDAAGHVVTWEHYFDAPDYPEVYFVGASQYYIAPGNWQIDADGIKHDDQGEDHVDHVPAAQLAHVEDLDVLDDDDEEADLLDDDEEE